MKKIVKYSTICFVMFALVLSMVSCSLSDALNKPKDKDFSKAGMTITLTDEFTENDLVTHTAYYVSQKAIVVLLKENDRILDSYSIKEYTELVCQTYNVDSSGIKNKDGYVELTYEKEQNGKDFYYYSRFYKNGKDFWSVQFGCETKNIEELQPFFEKWADTVRFD